MSLAQFAMSDVQINQLSVTLVLKSHATCYMYSTAIKSRYRQTPMKNNKFLTPTRAKNNQNTARFDKVIAKIKRHNFYGPPCKCRCKFAGYDGTWKFHWNSNTTFNIK